jgi:putative spermidine/putrescine transport system permease protein
MWPKSKPYFLILPALGTLAFLFYAGLLEGLVQSLGYFPAAGQSRFSLEAYSNLLVTEDFWDSLALTLRISILSTLIASILGVFVAVCLFMLGDGVQTWKPSILRRLFYFPLIIPHLVGAYLMVLLFMQSGWLSRIGFWLGWLEQIEDFPILVNDPRGWGIIFTYAWKEAPFIGLMIYPVLMRIHGSWLDAARVFGASNWRFFTSIVWPLILPALASSAFIVFAFTFSAFEVPFLLGVTYPKLLPVLSYDLYTSGGLMHRPEALAVNVILAVTTGILGLISYQLSKRWLSRDREGW